MRILKAGLLLLGSVCAAGLVVVLVYQFRSNAYTRAGIESARVQIREIDSLRTEHVRLAATEPARAKVIRGDQEELERRKIEADALRVQLAVLEKTNVPHADPHAGASARVKAQAAAVPVPPGMLTPETIQNVGRATPSQAWQTQMWASLKGEPVTKPNPLPSTDGTTMRFRRYSTASLKTSDPVLGRPSKWELASWQWIHIPCRLTSESGFPACRSWRKRYPVPTTLWL